MLLLKSLQHWRREIVISFHTEEMISWTAGCMFWGFKVNAPSTLTQCTHLPYWYTDSTAPCQNSVKTFQFILRKHSCFRLPQEAIRQKTKMVLQQTQGKYTCRQNFYLVGPLTGYSPFIVPTNQLSTALGSKCQDLTSVHTGFLECP